MGKREWKLAFPGGAGCSLSLSFPTEHGTVLPDSSAGNARADPSGSQILRPLAHGYEQLVASWAGKTQNPPAPEPGNMMGQKDKDWGLG